jgi:hypothetical protein
MTNIPYKDGAGNTRYRKNTGAGTDDANADVVLVETQGAAAHDAAQSGNPVQVGGRASAAAPADVSADDDVVRAWMLRNGATAVVLTAAGALVPGDATNGLDVDVTRSALPSGASTSAKQDTMQTALDAIKTAAEIIDNMISGSEAQVDVVTLPNVTLAAGTNTNEVVGDAAHDAAAAGNPVLEGGYASAAAPTDVSADGDVVRAWMLRNGARAVVLTAAGALIAGDASNGLDVDVTRLPALAAGTNAIGKLAANSGVDIGDVDVTSLPATPAGTNAIGKLLPPDIDVTGHTNYARKYYTSAGAATDGIVWSPAAGKRWHVTGLYFQVSAACTVTFEDDKAGGDDPVLKGEYPANGGAFLEFPEKYPLASGEDAADLLVTTSAGNIYVTVVGYEI